LAALTAPASSSQSSAALMGLLKLQNGYGLFV
jgi:hypothetical protein